MRGDRWLKVLLRASGAGTAPLALSILITLIFGSLPAIKKFGLHFLSSSVWNPVTDHFGLLPFLMGTILTSILALLLSFPFSMAISIFLGVYHPEGPLSKIISYLTDLLAGIPSVIYGFWGLVFLVPLMRKLELSLGIPPYGVGILTASIVLSIMIIPYTASLSREILKMVPSEIVEASYSLGATTTETILKVILPYAKSGILAGIFLSLGRAIGETMAVTMVIGNSNTLPSSLFAPGNTMASVIANEFTEATRSIHLSSLIYIALWLFVLTLLVNLAGNIIVTRMEVIGEKKNL